jgi:agmatinase
VVELCPGEHNKAPDFLAAKLIYKLLSYRFEG